MVLHVRPTFSEGLCTFLAHYPGLVTGSPTLTRGTALPYRVLAIGITLAHFAFSALVVFGGFLAWWQPWVLWLHLPAVVWAISGQLRDLPCPLTNWENSARVRGGWPRMAPTGYIDHYFTGVLYPRAWKPQMPFVVLGIMVVSWIGLLLR